MHIFVNTITFASSNITHSKYSKKTLRNNTTNTSQTEKIMSAITNTEHVTLTFETKKAAIEAAWLAVKYSDIAKIETNAPEKKLAFSFKKEDNETMIDLLVEISKAVGYSNLDCRNGYEAVIRWPKDFLSFYKLVSSVAEGGGLIWFDVDWLNYTVTVKAHELEHVEKVLAEAERLKRELKEKAA